MKSQGAVERPLAVEPAGAGARAERRREEERKPETAGQPGEERPLDEA